jgi:uncharacterized protein
MTDSPGISTHVHRAAGVACRPGCAACRIAPSISSPIPGMPKGKPAGVPCVQLAADLSCRLFGMVQRPAVCISLRPSLEMCGLHRSQALRHLAELERRTAPA